MLGKFDRKLFGAALLASTALAMPYAQAQVSTQFVNAQTGTTYTVLNTDCSKLVTLSNASAVAITLPQAGTVNRFQQGCFIDFENKGAGVVTITPTTSTVNGLTTFALNKNQGARLVSDGTNYQVQLGGGVSQGVTACAGTAAAKECDGIIGTVGLGSLTLAGLSVTQIAFTDTLVGVGSLVMCELTGYTVTQGFGTVGTNGVPIISQCTPTAGVITATLVNPAPLTGTLAGIASIVFQVLKQ